MSFEGVDFYDIDGHLTEEERAVRDMVRDWVDEELMPVINHHYHPPGQVHGRSVSPEQLQPVIDLIAGPPGALAQFDLVDSGLGER